MHTYETMSRNARDEFEDAAFAEAELVLIGRRTRFEAVTRVIEMMRRNHNVRLTVSEVGKAISQYMERS